MKIEKEKFYLKNNSTIDKKMCELQKHDVISIVPSQPHKQVYKVTDSISQIEALRLYGYVAEEKKYFKIVKIDYKKYLWWQF